MNYTWLFWVIVAIIMADFVFEKILDILNRKSAGQPLPKEAEGIYDSEKYQKQQEYFIANDKFQTVTGLVGLLEILLMLFTGGFAFVDSIALYFSSNAIIRALIFFAIISLASSIIEIPFSAYDTFVIEQRFGFNKTTVSTFIGDLVKNLLLTVIFGGLLITVLVILYTKLGFWFAPAGWCLMTVISIFINMFYSQLIVPLFNKQTPLEEGELRSEIEAFSEKAGFNLENVFVIDSSKRSTKANAYFIGLGPKKRIGLYDTLIEKLDKKEIVAVLAHEIGHYKKKHIVLNLILSIISSGIMFALMTLFLNNSQIAQVAGCTEASFHINMIIFFILYTPVSFILNIIVNILSRKHEYEADHFVKEMGLSKELSDALKKLTSENLSNLTPHPLYVAVNYSHPTLFQRLDKLKD